MRACTLNRNIFHAYSQKRSLLLKSNLDDNYDLIVIKNSDSNCHTAYINEERLYLSASSNGKNLHDEKLDRK